MTRKTNYSVYMVYIKTLGQNKNIVCLPSPDRPTKTLPTQKFLFRFFVTFFLFVLSILETGFLIRFYLYDDRKYLKCSDHRLCVRVRTKMQKGCD